MGKLRENKLSAWGLKDWDPISARPCVTHSLGHLRQVPTFYTLNSYEGRLGWGVGGRRGDLGRALRPHLPEPSTWAPRGAGASGAGHQEGGEAFLSVNKFVLRNTTPQENFYRKHQDSV